MSSESDVSDLLGDEYLVESKPVITTSSTSYSVTGNAKTVSTTGSDDSHKLKNGKVRGVSDRLLNPTAANISDQRTLHERTAALEMESQEQKSPSKNPKYEHVQSKLLQSTTAYSSQKIAKYDDREPEIEEPKKLLKVLDVNSSLLKPTAALTNSIYKKDGEEEVMKPEKQEISAARRASLKSGPDVESRLYEKTRAAETSRWKSKEELEAEEETRLEAERAAKANERKIKEPSAHILSSTAAVENAKYNRHVTESSHSDPREQGWKSHGGIKIFGSPTTTTITTTISPVEPMEPPAMKVKETSEHLLVPTVAMENSRWKSSAAASESNSPNIKASPRPIEENNHLLSKTAAITNASYKKNQVDEDPRERGWNSHFVKPVTSIIESPIPSPAKPVDDNGSVSPVKVKEASSRLLKPTKANEHAKWESPKETLELGSLSRRNSTSDTDTKKYREVPASLLRSTSTVLNAKYIPPEGRTKERRISLGEFKKDLIDRLIRPTTAANNGRYVKPEDRIKPDESISSDEQSQQQDNNPNRLKISTVSDRLLRPTVNNKYSKYVKPDEPVQIEENKPEHPKVREVSSRLLKLTVNNENSKWKDVTESSEEKIEQKRTIPVVTRGSRRASRATSPQMAVATPSPSVPTVEVDVLPTGGNMNLMVDMKTEMILPVTE